MKSVFVLLCCAALAGCVTQPAQRGANLSSTSDEFVYSTDMKDLAARRRLGIIGELDYLTQAYDLAERYKHLPEAAQMRPQLARMIPLARQAESGQISREQYQDIRRIADTEADSKAMQEREAQRRQKVAEDLAKQESFLRTMELSRRLMQPPPPPPIQPSNSFNCRSYRVGNAIQTDCN